MSDVIVRRKPGRPKKELAGNPDTGEIEVVEVEVKQNTALPQQRGVHTFVSLVRDAAAYRVLELRVDLDRGVVLSEVDHEPTLKAIAEDEFKIAVVKKIWSKVD